MDPLTGPTQRKTAQVDTRPDRLTSREGRALGLWILAGLLGAALAARYFFVAFPEAAMDFRVTRVEAEEVAREFVHQHIDPNSADHPLDPYDRSFVFAVEEDANGGGPKVYLERELGLAEANRLMSGDVSVWYWNVRYFRPLQQEEYRVRVSPAGRVVGYHHIVEEARAGARVNQPAAKEIAERFLRERVGFALDNYEYLPEEANSIERPNRRDWKFTWERRGFRAKDAPYRAEVTVHGDHAGGFREFLKVPEAWTRDFARLRSSNLLYQFAAQVPYMFVMGAALLVVFDLGKKGLAPWRGALALGVAVAGLYFLMNVNQWPLTRADYNTNSSYTGFFVNEMAVAALVSVLLGLTVALSVAAGEPLYRSLLPQMLQLRALFTRGSWKGALGSKEFFSATVIGLAMAAAHIGFVVMFYLLGRDVGFWSPQEIRYTDAISTYAPWVFPLAISVFAATSEEFLFRLFAIPFLLRLTRSRAVAIVLPAFIWGFLHSAYPQQPGYVRGIEVGIIGVVAGWVMLRWGILATLVWHYTVDALLIGLFLLRSESAYFKWSGLVVVALTVFPLFAATGLFVVRRRFIVDAALLNAARPPVAAEEKAQPTEAATVLAQYDALSSGARRGLLLAAVAATALLLLPRPAVIGDFVRFPTTAASARSQAGAAMRAKGIDPARYWQALSVVNNFDGSTVEFLRRRLGVAGTNALYRDRVPSAFWSVRYFRDNEKEEYRVVLLPDGKLHSIHHLLSEDAPGASLTKEEAQARGEAWLRDEKGLDLAQWKLVEAKSDKRAKRTDHLLVWEEVNPVDTNGLPVPPGEAAHVRRELKVQGEEVSGYRTYIKLPEEWLRKHEEETLPRTLYTVGRILSIAIAGVWVLVVFFSNLRRQEVPWQRISRWAVWSALAILVNTANNLPQLLAAYTTEVPLRMFLGLTVLSLFFTVAVLYGLVFLALALGWFFLARAFGADRMPTWRGMPGEYYRDALWIGIGGVGPALFFLARLPAWADGWLPTLQQRVHVRLPGSLDSYVPAAGEIAGPLIFAFALTGLLGLVAGLVAQWKKNRWALGPVIAGLALLFAGTPHSAADFAKNFVVAALQLGAAWFFVARMVRFNMLGCFLLIATTLMTAGAMELLQQPAAYYKVQGVATAAGVLLLLGWALRMGRGASNGQPPAVETTLSY